MKGSLIVGIDAGYRNLAICALRAGAAAPEVWQVSDILGRQKATRLTLHRCMMRWCDEHQALLQEASMIVLEVQRKALFQNLNTVIMTLYPNKFRLLHPFTLCAYYQLPRTRVAKKAETVKRVKTAFPNAMPTTQVKIDDLADAALFAMWGHQQK